MSNLEIREFTQAITNFVDGSELPEEVKRMALQEVLTRQEQKVRDAADTVKQEEVKQDAGIPRGLYY